MRKGPGHAKIVVFLCDLGDRLYVDGCLEGFDSVGVGYGNRDGGRSGGFSIVSTVCLVFTPEIVFVEIAALPTGRTSWFSEYCV